jgi:hypothetical protein
VGDVGSRRARSPFARLRLVVTVMVTYALAAALWVTVGPTLPGGRWFAVHLFTLGVLTNAIVAFSAHFSATLTRQPGVRGNLSFAALNLGIVLTLIGVATGPIALFAVGAVLTTGAVLENHIRIRRQRRAAVGARFTAVVRTYERAHGAFVLGAGLGALLGLGLIGDAWFWPVRLAHLHVNLLGWAGLTLLATIVFFGPTIARTRIERGADESAAPAMRRAAAALTAAALLLIATGVGGAVGVVLRLAAAAALAIYAHAAGVILLPVIRAVAGGRRAVSSRLILAGSVWFLVAAWAAVLVVATAGWGMLDALGLALLLGVLVQAVAATLTYITPMIVRPDAREGVHARLEALPIPRTAAVNVGAAAAVVAAVGGSTLGAAGPALSRLGWMLVLAILLWQVLVPAIATLASRVR